MKMKIENHPFHFKKTFVITGYTFTVADTVRVILEDNGYIGRGEAIGIFYEDETAEKIMTQLDAVADKIVGGITNEDIQELLPLGGARAALDCALWNLKAKKAKK